MIDERACLDEAPAILQCFHAGTIGRFVSISRHVPFHSGAVVKRPRDDAGIQGRIGQIQYHHLLPACQTPAPKAQVPLSYPIVDNILARVDNQPMDKEPILIEVFTDYV